MKWWVLDGYLDRMLCWYVKFSMAIYSTGHNALYKSFAIRQIEHLHVQVAHQAFPINYECDAHIHPFWRLFALLWGFCISVRLTEINVFSFLSVACVIGVTHMVVRSTTHRDECPPVRADASSNTHWNKHPSFGMNEGTSKCTKALFRLSHPGQE